jgi:hypothetical protein
MHWRQQSMLVRITKSGPPKRSPSTIRQLQADETAALIDETLD